MPAKIKKTLHASLSSLPFPSSLPHLTPNVHSRKTDMHMLARSPPRSLFASDYSLGTGMAASPSQFPMHLHGQNTAGFMHAMPLDHQPAIQSSASMSFGGSDSGAQCYMSSTASMPQLSHPNRLTSSPSTSSRFAPHSRPLLAPLSIGDSLVNTGLLATGGHSQSGSSTPSSTGHQQATYFSRRSEGTNESSPSTSPTDLKQFGRITSTGGRQRSAQACQKCRDRKTKVSAFATLLQYSITNRLS